MTGEHRTLLVSPYPGVLRQAVVPTAHTHGRIIVPNRRAGQGLGRWCDRGPSPITLTRLAQDTLRAAGWTALPTGERQRWMRAILEEGPLTMLTEIRDRDGTAAQLLSLMGEFQRAHLQPDDLLRVARPGREQDAARVYAAYHAQCVAEQRYDAAGAEHFAAGLDDLHCRPTLVHGFAYLDAAQVALIDRLCGLGSVLTLPAGPCTAARTGETLSALTARGWTTEQLLEPPQTAGDRAIHGFLTAIPVPTLSAGEYPDIDGEVRACLRQVRDWLADGTPPERLAIVVRTEGQYLDTLADVAAEYGVPLRSGGHRPLLETGLGQLLQAWMDAHTRSWTFRACEALLTHPLVARPDLLERARSLRPLRTSGLGAWGHDLRWLALPEHTTWRAALIGTVQRLLDDFGVLAHCRDDAELNRLVTPFLDRLHGDARRDAPCTREEVLARVGHTLRSIQVRVLTGKSAVPVLNPLGALAGPADRVWLLGLSDSLFPAARRDDSLIDTHIRQRWSAQGVHLPDLRSLTSVEDALILAMLGVAQAELVISRPRRELTGQPLAPSPYWTRLQAQRPVGALDAGSDAEREVQDALRGDLSSRAARGQTIERAQRLPLPSPHRGQLGAGVPVSGHTWTLLELQIATTCRMRWWLEFGLLLSPAPPPWDVLTRAALEDALSTDHAPEAQVALDRAARGLRDSGTWHPGPLWPAQQLELRGRARQLVDLGDVVEPGAAAVPTPRERVLSVAAHGHRFRIRLAIDRLEDTLHGRRVTVYRRTKPTGGLDLHSPLTLDLQLALTLQAAPADVGRYLALDTGRAFGTLRHVPHPSGDSPITQAREVLAGLGDRLAAGDVQPCPVPELCRTCPVRTVCRVSPPEAA